MPRDAIARVARALTNRATVARLQAQNRVSSATILGTADCVVSLTTYGDRTQKVFQTIESIASGRLRPRQMVLWLDDAETFEHLPPSLQRLTGRGLTISKCENYRSHKKYYPYVAQQNAFEVPLITADDDVIYPASWLAELMEAHRQTPAYVVAQRARRMQVATDGTLAPYAEWPEMTTSDPAPHVFPTGVSGVLYPPAVLMELKSAGTAFLDLAPSSDDAWLHFHTQQAGTRARQVHPVAQDYFGIIGSQESALWKTNVDQGENDLPLSRLYTPETLRRFGITAA